MGVVLIKTTGNVHWLEPGDGRAELAKAASFWRHFGKCAAGCPACRANVPFDRWWTTHPEALAQLSELARNAGAVVRFESDTVRICVGGIVAADRRREGRRTGAGSAQVEMREREPGCDDD